MARFFMGEETQERMELGLTRALVLLSFTTHLTMALLAGIRRRRDSGLRRFLVWLAYYVTEKATPIALGMVFLDTNKGLTPTHIVGPVLAIGGAIYGSYKQRFMRGDGALRYVDRVVALHRASFAKIHCSNKEKKLRRISIEDKGRSTRDNDDVLLDAHGILGVTMAAFADYKVNSGGYQRSYSDWKDLSKVVEMEASLMYDIYTKATVIHTWGGYYHPCLALENADRMATYISLVGTLLLDGRWLLRALGSTWTYALLVDKQQDQEEESRQHACRRAGRQLWYYPRCLLVSLDPSRLSLRSGTSGHRLLPGVGQHNLLQECSSPLWGPLQKVVSFFARPGRNKIDVKDELLEAMCAHVLLESGTTAGRRPTRELGDYMGCNQEHYSFESNLITFHVATDIFLLHRPRSPGIESEASVKYETKIQAISDYMMFLLTQRKHMILKPGDEGSDYKKSLLDLKEIWRVTGTSGPPKTRARRIAKSLLYMDAPQGSDRKSSFLFNTNKTLALGAGWGLKLLHELDSTRYDSGRDPMSARYIHGLEDFIQVFTEEAQTNIKRYRDSREQWQLLNYVLKLILDSWVRFLTFMSQECSRESHAKQLSCGGELLTIVWLMKQHVIQCSEQATRTGML
ncbi:hypothetical protein VPH35_119614 [Triticum aestivum]